MYLYTFNLIIETSESESDIPLSLSKEFKKSLVYQLELTTRYYKKTVLDFKPQSILT